MDGFPKRTKLASSLLGVILATGCQLPQAQGHAVNSSPNLATKAVPFRQLIIKFKPNTIACDAAGIARLSADVRVDLEYVRPLSGNACVIKQFDNAVKTAPGYIFLKQHPAVEWVEVDAVMKAS